MNGGLRRRLRQAPLGRERGEPQVGVGHRFVVGIGEGDAHVADLQAWARAVAIAPATPARSPAESESEPTMAC